MNLNGKLWNNRPLDHWVEMLRHGDDETRWQAVDAIRHLAHPSDSLHFFLSALGDSYWPVRALAAHALYDIAHDENAGQLLSEAVEPLANALRDEYLDVGLNAAYTLELLGASAIGALPQLQEALELGGDQLRNAASDAITRIKNG